MGNKDKTRDKTTATSSEESRDTALARTYRPGSSRGLRQADSQRDQTYHRNFHKADGEDSGTV